MRFYEWREIVTLHSCQYGAFQLNSGFSTDFSQTFSDVPGSPGRWKMAME